jgi:hypothetical protein
MEMLGECGRCEVRVEEEAAPCPRSMMIHPLHILPVDGSPDELLDEAIGRVTGEVEGKREVCSDLSPPRRSQCTDHRRRHDSL